MGLSQYRGGKHTLKDHLENPNKGYGKKKPSEAHMMGQHLSKHIHELHGAGFWSDFGDGFKKGFTGTLDVLKPATALIPGFNQTMDTVRGVAGMGVSEEQRASEIMSKKRVGRTHNNGGGRMVGCGDTGAYEGHGKLMEGGMLGKPGHGTLRTGGRVKRMVGAGVKARADLVRKVMADKGLKMIEASKYVKEHGLY
jgi:hypothetical protein